MVVRLRSIHRPIQENCCITCVTALYSRGSLCHGSVALYSYTARAYTAALYRIQPIHYTALYADPLQHIRRVEYYLRLLEYYQSQKRFHSVILSRSRGHHRIQRRKLGLGRSNNNPHFLLPLQTLHSQKLARPTFSLDGSDGLSLDGARRRAAAHGSSE